jgi:hypothetical protein
MYAPRIKSVRRVREHRLSDTLSAVLLTDIVGESSFIEYRHLLVVCKSGEAEPVACVSAEARAPLATRFRQFAAASGAAFPAFELPDDCSLGSHYLCTFVAGRHGNCGCSDDWADLDKFERAALELLPTLLAETILD